MKNQFTFSIKSLKLLSIGYLALPVILFFIFWLKPAIAIFLVGILAYSFYRYFKNEQPSETIKIPYLQLFGILAILSVWVFISGAGGWGAQSPDLSKHSSIFKDIIENSTPISYLYNGQKIYLAAYLGYYIPVPLLFGWLSWPAMMFLVTIWTLIGALIGVLWFCILVESFSIKWVLFFVLVGGLDFAGLIHNIGLVDSLKVLFEKFYDTLPFFAIQIDQKMLLLYQANTHSLFWGPQHALICWIATGLFFYDWQKHQNIQNSPLYLVLVPFWSPFILMGLAPFIVYQVFKDGFQKYISWQNLLLIPIFLIIIWFVNSVPVTNLEKGLIFYQPERLLNYLGELKAYTFFLFFEIIVWAIPAYLIFKKSNNKKSLFVLIFITILLIIIPIYKLGKWNDFVQRVSMPALFFLWVLVAQSWKQTKSIGLKITFILLFIIGSWDSVYHLLFSLKATNYKIKYTAIRYEKVTNFVETSKREKWPIEQSFAPDSASFFRYLAR
ncbi:MAG: hypothetical protein V4683_12545 [Bacteroidota bacterium]